MISQFIFVYYIQYNPNAVGPSHSDPNFHWEEVVGKSRQNNALEKNLLYYSNKL